MLGHDWVSWCFRRVRGSKIPRYFAAMLPSGIWKRLEIEITAGVNRGREPVVHPPKAGRYVENTVSQTVKSGLVTLFILCACVILISALSYTVECYQFIKVVILRWITVILRG